MNRKLQQMNIVCTALAAGLLCAPVYADQQEADHKEIVLKADTLFDGTKIWSGAGPYAVRVGSKGKITQAGLATDVDTTGAKVLYYKGGSIVPTFIDAHTHHLLNEVPALRLLEHGVTTARDLGSPEPIKAATTGKTYELRQFMSGPILSKAGGYPNNVFPGSGLDINIPGDPKTDPKTVVDRLVAQGASVISVSLEGGGEVGAPWMKHDPVPAKGWPVMSGEELDAIVLEAHKKGIKVAAYLGDQAGADMALLHKVDEWAHMPCNLLTPKTFMDAAAAGVVIDGTLDTEVACEGVLEHGNAIAFLKAGGKLLYATDNGHTDIPNGADAEEIHHIFHAEMINAIMNKGMSPPPGSMDAIVDAVTVALTAATSAPAKYLLGNKTLLGQLVPGAPADVMVIGSNVMQNFKELEYPRIVMKDGQIVIQRTARE